MEKLIQNLLTVNRLVRDEIDKVDGAFDQKEFKTLFAKSGLSPLSVKKFNKLDTNKSGKIEESELGTLIKMLVQSHLRNHLKSLTAPKQGNQ